MLNSIKSLGLVLVLVSVLFGSIFWLIQNRIASNARAEVGQSLRTVLDTTHQAVRSWIKEHKSKVILWANTDEISLAAASLLETPRTRSALLNADGQLKLRSWFKPVQKHFHYYGYFVVSPDHINLASSRDENIGVKNLLITQERYLQRIWQGETIFSLPQRSDVPLPDKDGVLREGLPTMFVGTPILSETGEVIAIFTFRLNPAEDFSTLFSQGRIGDTGETYAFNKQGRLISNSRFDNQLQSIGLIPSNSYSILNVAIRDPGANLLKGFKSEIPKSQQNLTRMAASATAGNSGLDLQGFRDYRGVPVVAAWLWDPDLNFGISTEQDVQEAYSALQTTRYVIFTQTLMLALLSLALFVIYGLQQRRKQTQMSLQQSELSLRRLVDTSPVAMIVEDNNEHFEFVNHKFNELFGYSVDDIHNMESWSLRAYPNEDYRNKLMHQWSMALEKAKHHETLPIEAKVTCKDGSVRDIEYRFSSIGDRYLIILNDFTRSKRTEQALRNAEQFLKSALEGSPVAIVIAEAPDGNIIYVNQAVLNFRGKTDAPLTDIKISEHIKSWNVLYPDGRKYKAEDLPLSRAILKGETVEHEELIIRLDDGTNRWATVHAAPIKNEINEITSGIVVFSDITQQKIDAAARQESEERLKLATESAKVGLWDLNYQTGDCYYSPTYMEMLGYQPNELPHTVDTWKQLTGDEDQKQSWDKFKNYLNQGDWDAYLEIEFRTKTKSGTYRCMVNRGRVVETDNKGKPLRIIGTMVDITDRKLAEEKAQTLLELGPDAIVVANREGKITFVNEQTEKTFGYARDELIGQSIERLIPDRFQKIHVGHRQEFYGDPKIRTMGADLELYGKHKDGLNIPVEISLSPFESDEGLLVASAVRDISERKKEQNELNQHRFHLQDLVDKRTAELRASNEELESYSYSIAHDLRTPLRAITSFSQILVKNSKQKLDEEDIDSLQRIVKAGKKMARLIDDILELSRITRSELHLANVNLSKLGSEIVEHLEHAQPNKKVHWHIQDDLIVKGDSHLLEVALQNLLENAWKYTDITGYAEIEVGQQKVKNEIIYYVKDNGIGFDMNHSSNLFKPFHTLHTSRNIEGSGVGLATAQRVIQRHGGRLWAEAEKDHGAVFYFSLPQDYIQ